MRASQDKMISYVDDVTLIFERAISSKYMYISVKEREKGK